jgi:hypothetical protein
MKSSLILALVFIALLSQKGFAACDESAIQKAVEKYSDVKDHGYGTRFDSAKLHGILLPGQKMNVQVSIENFNVVNSQASEVLVASLYGRNLIGDSFWLAQIDPRSCAVVKASEVLGQGGAGL